ncbi:MAG TPA: hypothetical protein VH081_10110 [Solirubrobacteraceae bacterium]|nr:hypothetical protein [Solirubrobacteraceae bacterium]
MLQSGSSNRCARWIFAALVAVFCCGSCAVGAVGAVAAVAAQAPSAGLLAAAPGESVQATAKAFTASAISKAEKEQKKREVAERRERKQRERQERKEAKKRGGSGGGSGGATPDGTIIGTDDGSGWGPAPAKTLIDAGIDWSREEVGYDSISGSVKDGFKVLGIVANTNDGTPLSKTNVSQWAAEVVSQLRANPGISIAEAGNEMYLKGGIAEPVQYGRMYLAAVNAMKAAGITTPLLFNNTGDYPHGTWSSPTTWSRDSSGGGWLREAVNAVPGLAGAILANGVAIHPYGTVGENKNDDYGVNAPAAEETTANAVLGAIPKFYITEFGYDLSSCGRDLGACSKQEQASKLTAAYDVFTADPHIAGIWWYQSHDDSTGQFGLMNNDNSIRPSFTALSTIAREEDG